ncbi:MAG: lipoyl(octanoyl) transferase LipB [Pseudomonadota bacterium]
MSKSGDIEWRVSTQQVDYLEALAFMEARARAIRDGGAAECIWLLEHPPLYTSGTSAKIGDLRDPSRFPVFDAGRGGQYTYHGPGQRVAYVMLDLNVRGKDVRAFVRSLEDWIVQTLAILGVEAGPREGRVGVWVDRTPPGGELREDKIAAIGVRLRRWVSFHGVSLNVSPDLSHFAGITPCGIDDPQFGVTSLADLGVPADMLATDRAMRTAFESIFSVRVSELPGPDLTPAPQTAN